MIENSKQNTPQLSDHEAFQLSTLELESRLKGSSRSAILEIAALLVAIGFPPLFGAAGFDTKTAIIVDGVLLLLLFSRSRDLLRYKNIKAILVRQLKIATKQRVRADKLYDLSILDPLTGLHNRRFGEQRLREEIARSETNSEPLAVILFDLDYFKEINDKFGHAGGDLALREFSRKLRRAIRSCDVPVRMGGDEFLLILPECPTDNVGVILSRIQSPEIEYRGEKISIGYSFGRAHYQYTDTAKTLIARADQVLYAAKSSRPEISSLPKSPVEAKLVGEADADSRSRQSE